jgi:hypothetical protein
VERSAVLDHSGQYRYRLDRRWSAGPTATFVLLNPSTADGEVDDPTLRRCMGFAKAWGCGGLVVVNLFALRTPDPKELGRAKDPVGPENDAYLRAAVDEADCVVLGWGASGLGDRAESVLSWLPRPLMCLGMTRGGAPRHPLYLSKQTQREAYDG